MAVREEITKHIAAVFAVQVERWDNHNYPYQHTESLWEDHLQTAAATEEARAEVERAKGTARANKIVANSITEPYLRYLYINNLHDTDNQVIYLPTEAGLPILEAGRLRKK